MKPRILISMLILAASVSADACTALQTVQLHQFRDLFLYLYQNTGYFPQYLGDCAKRFGNDVYFDQSSQDPQGTSVIIGRNFPVGGSPLQTTPASLVLTINDPRLIDNPDGTSWNGFFSDVDVDNFLRSLLNGEGRKKNIVLMNYIRGLGTDQVLHLVSFFFDGESKKRYFIVDTRPTSMSFVVTDSIEWLKKMGAVSFSKASFSAMHLKSNRSGLSYGFDKCLVSMRVYPDQPVANLASCASALYDLKNSLWKVRGKSLDDDSDYLNLYTFFVNQFDKERAAFSLDLFNLLVLSRLRWLHPIVFSSKQVARRLTWETCHAFNPRTYDGLRKLTAKDRALLEKMFAVIQPGCLKKLKA